MLRGSVLMLLLLASPALSQSSPAELVKRLGSGSFAERERAAKELDRLGELALPSLEKASQGDDVETQRRATALMRRIEERVMGRSLLQATPMRFRYQNESIHDALRDIEKRTSLKLGWPDYDWTRRKITVDTGTLPFWQAWAEFCKQASIHEAPLVPRPAEFIDNLNMLVIADGKLPEKHEADQSQSVRVRIVRQPLPSQPEALRFGVEIRAEPRLELFGVGDIEWKSLVLAPGDEETLTQRSKLESTFAESLARPAGAYKITPAFKNPDGAKSLPLMGKAATRILARHPAIKIANLADAAGKNFTGLGDVKLRVLDVIFTDTSELTLRLHASRLDSLRDAALEPATTRTRSGVVTLLGPADIALAQLELLDSAGKPLVRMKESYSDKNDGFELNLVYAAPAKGNVSLTLNCLRIVTVPLAFRATRN
jgi:hypothetical protein